MFASCGREYAVLSPDHRLFPAAGGHTIGAAVHHQGITQDLSQRGALIIYPRFQGRRGHPPLISTACVAGLPPDCDGGLRAFLGRYGAAALDLEVMDEAVILDCDTPEDYRRLQAYASRQDT